ncbi:MgtC/SapB family protein [Mycobacteroides abscessus]|uniref:MgtC/SapB family protein n=1 Tax=Mycobacteroides abscessus TaxID=36809 RepID=UPI0009A816EF|nr:MgtC/SapB family protein [Mycobacteroides abscessus]
MALADSVAMFGGAGQGGRQLVGLLAAFVLSGTIGLEREIAGKSAGLRTQTIVGTSAALILLVSKYGFDDVLSGGIVILDPSRVAAQIVSGIGFLGAGIIIMRRGAVHGLTTAAAIWESAAVGMAAGAGLLLLAMVVTVLHFATVFGLAALGRLLTARLHGAVSLHVTYADGRGVLRQLLNACNAHRWSLLALSADPPAAPQTTDSISPGIAREVGVVMTLSGTRLDAATNVLAAVDGVHRIDRLGDDIE